MRNNVVGDDFCLVNILEASFWSPIPLFQPPISATLCLLSSVASLLQVCHSSLPLYLVLKFHLCNYLLDVSKWKFMHLQTPLYHLFHRPARSPELSISVNGLPSQQAAQAGNVGFVMDLAVKLGGSYENPGETVWAS